MSIHWEADRRRRYALLVFSGPEAIGEYSFRADSDAVALKTLQNLNPCLEGVILGNGGVLGMSAHLSIGNVWRREGVPQITANGGVR